MKSYNKAIKSVFILLLTVFWFTFVNGFAQSTGQAKMAYTDSPVAAWPTETDTVTTAQELLLIDLLDSSLGTLADKDRRGRMTGGYIMLGLGAGTVVGGAVTLLAAENDDARIVGYSLIGGGALLGGLSLIPFKVRSETERLYDEFSSSLGEAPEANPQRFYYWDRRFEELAENSKRQRIIGGVTSIVAGAVTAFVLVDETPEAQLHTFIWPAMGGITSMIIKSDEERQYEIYQRSREDILNQNVRAGIDVQYGLVPIPQGGVIGAVRVRF